MAQPGLKSQQPGDCCSDNKQRYVSINIFLNKKQNTRHYKSYLEHWNDKSLKKTGISVN